MPDKVHFPSFSEGLSLREKTTPCGALLIVQISLPFRRDFH